MTLFRFFILTISCSCFSICLFSQKVKRGEQYFSFDENWKPVGNVDKATYFARSFKVNDTMYVFSAYHMFGPMVTKEVYKDSENKIPHGEWFYYGRNGYVDSVCSFVEGMAHGNWAYVNDTGRMYMLKIYEKGKLVRVRDLIIEDSIRAANKDSLEKKDPTEVESTFRGSVGAWANYLTRNLQYPDRAIKNYAQGEVVVQFIVDKEGQVGTIDIFKSVEFSLDEEAVRMIQQSPKWEPARKGGKIVKSYKRQPIIYRLPN